MELHPENLKPFAKGDPRINRHGRPKSFKQLRALVVDIAQEPIKDGEVITRIEKMIRDMLKSDNPSDRALVLKYGFGNVPDEQNVKSDNKVTLTVKYEKPDSKPTEAAQ